MPGLDDTGKLKVTGLVGNYKWLTVERLNGVVCDISLLLRLCPDIVLGKYLAVTSIDGGALQLTEEEKRDGWFTTEKSKIFRFKFDRLEYREDWLVAYSPRLVSIHGLPNETHDECCAGFDEWYVFPKAPLAAEMEVFVNWMGFRLDDPVWKEHTDRFWEQMERLAPESYIADGTAFTIATRNSDLFASVLRAFSER
jgi:hypothetical protein